MLSFAGFATTDELAKHSKERYQLHAGHGINRTTVYVCLVCFKPWTDPAAVIQHIIDAHCNTPTAAKRKGKKNTKPPSATENKSRITIDPTDLDAVLRHVKKIRLVRVFTNQAAHLMEVVENEAFLLVKEKEEDTTDVNNCVIETTKMNCSSPDIKINISPKRPASKTSSVCEDEQRLLDMADEQVLKVINPEDEDDVIMIVMDENAGVRDVDGPEVNLSRASRNGSGAYILKDYNKRSADIDPISKLKITSVHSQKKHSTSSEPKHIFGFKKRRLMAAVEAAKSSSRLVLDANR